MREPTPPSRRPDSGSPGAPDPTWASAREFLAVLEATETYLRVMASTHLSLSSVIAIERRAVQRADALLADLGVSARREPSVGGVDEATDELLSQAVAAGRAATPAPAPEGLPRPSPAPRAAQSTPASAAQSTPASAAQSTPAFAGRSVPASAGAPTTLVPDDELVAYEDLEMVPADGEPAWVEDERTDSVQSKPVARASALDALVSFEEPQHPPKHAAADRPSWLADEPVTEPIPTSSLGSFVTFDGEDDSETQVGAVRGSGRSPVDGADEVPALDLDDAIVPLDEPISLDGPLLEALDDAEPHDDEETKSGAIPAGIGALPRQGSGHPADGPAARRSASEVEEFDLIPDLADDELEIEVDIEVEAVDDITGIRRLGGSAARATPAPAAPVAMHRGVTPVPAEATPGPSPRVAASSAKVSPAPAARVAGPTPRVPATTPPGLAPAPRVAAGPSPRVGASASASVGRGARAEAFGNVPTIRDGGDGPKPRAAAIQLNAQSGTGRVVGLEEEEEPIEIGAAEDYGEDEVDVDSDGGFRLDVQEYEDDLEELEEEDDEVVEPALPTPAAPPPAAPIIPTTAELQALFERARSAAESGDMQKGADLFSDVIDADPDNVEAHVGRGRLYLDLGDYTRAMSDFMVAEDLAPESPEPQIAIGDLYFARKDYRKAIEYFDAALEMAPNHAMAFCRRGISHYYRKNYRDSLKDLQRAQELEPDIPNIATYISMAKKKAKK